MIITLLRKPLDGSVAENALQHGCGAINIDATRVGTEVMTSIAMGSLGVMHDDAWKSKPIDPVESTGRWPANFILTHLEGCESQDEKWACVEGCPVRELDIQSGHLKSTTRKPTGNPIYPTSNTSVKWNANNVIDTTQRGFNDDGGASRFFMQFQKDN